jgi:tripartite-type tricarboxylate transporter receptor subunit TctC
MQARRRTLVKLAALAALPVPAAAQEWPAARTVRLVNPYAPGGSTELVVRLVSQRLTESLKQSVIVDNRPGAGSNIGNEAVVRAAPDGYTLLNGTSSLAINPALYPRLGYDPVKDLVPIVTLTRAPNVLAVHPSVPANSVRELIAYVRANPGKLNYGSSGNGATNHLAMEQLKVAARLAIVHIPYKGGGPALADLLAGNIQLMFNPPSSLMPHHRTGKVRALAVSSAERFEGVELPTIAESGLPGFESTVWFALFAPAGTPAPVIERLNAEVNRVLQDPAVRQQLLGNGLIPVGGTAEALGRLLREDLERWAQVVRASGAKVD